MNYSQAIAQTDSSNTLKPINSCCRERSARVLAISLLAAIVLTISSACSTRPAIDTAVAREIEPKKAAPAKDKQELSEVLDSLLDGPEFGNGRWGIAVVSLQKGQVLYQRNADKLFTPASNMKVYTTSVALDLLGADYRWRTSVYSDSQPDAAGTINGNLRLVGRGAPDLVATTTSEDTNSLDALAQMLSERGIKRIRGNVIGDESYFRGESTGDGWQWNDLQWYFGAEASALSINGNSADISITAATKSTDKPVVAVRDDTGYFELTNNLTTTSPGNKFRLGVHRNVSDNKVVVWGEVPLGSPGYGATLSVHRPSLWAAQLFIRALKGKGISVDGGAAFADSRVPEQNRFNPEGKTELAFVSSKSLAEIVRQTNKQSINLYAELLLRTLGRERGSMLSGFETGGREVGDDERGAALIRLWLGRSGIPITYLGIHDGSGLSRLNLVTPKTTALLLAQISRRPAFGAFYESLPISGTDGTLRGRLQDLKDRVRAKTGALTYDHSLSGYLTTSEGEALAFSIMSNDFLGNGGIRLIDRLVSALAGEPESSPATSKSRVSSGKQ